MTESPHAVYAICDITGEGVEWTGHIFKIDLYKVPSQVRDAVRDKEPVCLYNPVTKQTRIAKYDHSVTLAVDRHLEYVYRVTQYPSGSDFRIILTNVV
jgi:hypothetical protein